MEIYLIRHTATEIEAGVCYGHADVPLKDTFEKEAEIVFKKVPQDIDAIYSSPLTRCMRLADYLASRLGATVIREDNLKELNFGEWELKKWDDVDALQLQQWMDDYVYRQCPGGESYYDLVMRADIFLHRLKNTHCRKTVVVCHHGIMKALFAVITHCNLKTAMDKHWTYGEMYKIVI